MVMGSKVAGLRHIFISIMTMNIENQQYTKTTWIMGGRESGMITISISLVTINTLSTIVKVIVAGILIPNSTTSIIINTITYFFDMDTFVERLRIKR